MVDDLPKLSDFGGFKNFLKLGAEQYNIRGTIQRIPTTRVKIFLVCSEHIFQLFYKEFLLLHAKEGMYKINYESYASKNFLLPEPHNLEVRQCYGVVKYNCYRCS